MLVDSNILPECIVRPGSFGGLMTMYEANYIKLARLIPDLARRSGSAISAGLGDCDLHLTIESQTKYTCELRLTYLFAEDGLDAATPENQKQKLIADPDLVATIYFDARLAEVSSWLDNHKHTVLQNLHRACARELDVRWSRNIMFSKWLDYLQERGHYFPSRNDLSA